MKTFYKTNAAAFKNSAGYWDKSMLRERGIIETLEPNIIWQDVFKKIEPMGKGRQGRRHSALSVYTISYGL